MGQTIKNVHDPQKTSLAVLLGLQNEDEMAIFPFSLKGFEGFKLTTGATNWSRGPTANDLVGCCPTNTSLQLETSPC